MRPLRTFFAALKIRRSPLRSRAYSQSTCAMGGPFQEMGAASSGKKPKIDPWARSAAKDRFSGATSMNPQAYAIERTKSPAPKRDHTPLRATRPVSVPKKERPAPALPLMPSVSKVDQPPTTPAAPSAGSSRSQRGSPPFGKDGLKDGSVQAGVAKMVPAAVSAFAPSSKSRFDSGPGSFYVNPDRAAPGVGTFMPSKWKAKAWSYQMLPDLPSTPESEAAPLLLW